MWLIAAFFLLAPSWTSHLVLAQSCTALGGSGSSYKDGRGNIYTLACTRDVQIQDLSSSAASSFAECFNKCGAITACQAFSYIGGQCYFKYVQGSTAKPFRRDECDLAYRSGAFAVPSCSELYSKGSTYTDQTGKVYDLTCGADPPNSDIKSLTVGGFEDCFYQCGSTVGCQGFAYIRDTRVCYLKNFKGTNGVTYVTNSNIDSAVMPGTANPSCKGVVGPSNRNKFTTSSANGRQYQVACENDMNGSGDIGSKVVSNFVACLELCDVTTDCVAATFSQSGGGCFMKSFSSNRDINPAPRTAFDFAYLTSIPTKPTQPKSQTGSWGPQINFPLIPVAAAVIPQTGKLLVWSAAKRDMWTAEDPNMKFTLFAEYDPKTGQVSERSVSNTGHDMFCPGISFDVNGRLIVNGGSTAKVVSIFDPTTNAWTRAADLRISRGYQSSTILSNGKIFTIGGSWSGGRGGKIGEIYDPSANTWTTLSGCPVDPILTNDVEGVYRSDNHAWIFGWKNGYVFHAGPSKAMNWFGTSGSGSRTAAGARGDAQDAMSGSAVMFDVVNGIGKILTAGGSPSYSNSPASKSVHLITINSPTSGATVQRLADLTYARTLANAVVLPTGDVLVTGGQSYAEIFTDNNPTLYPELWSPKTNAFRVLDAKEPTARTYHSVSILMPDGTVFSGGGGLCGNCGTNNHFDGRIFSPPYLFKSDGGLATRPQISSLSSTSVRVGGSFSVSVTPASSSSSSNAFSFALVRIGSVTHSVNTDQRRISLVPTKAQGSTYTLQVPGDSGVVPPGYYFLFVVEGDVPSVSRTLQVRL